MLGLKLLKHNRRDVIVRHTLLDCSCDQICFIPFYCTPKIVLTCAHAPYLCDSHTYTMICNATTFLSYLFNLLCSLNFYFCLSKIQTQFTRFSCLKSAEAGFANWLFNLSAKTIYDFKVIKVIR